MLMIATCTGNGQVATLGYVRRPGFVDTLLVRRCSMLFWARGVVYDLSHVASMLLFLVGGTQFDLQR